MTHITAQPQGNLDHYLSILGQIQDAAGPDCDAQDLTTAALCLAREAKGVHFETRTQCERNAIFRVVSHMAARNRKEIL